MEKEPQLDQIRVAQLVTGFVRKHMIVDLQFDDDTGGRYIVSAQAARAIGVTETGEIPDSVSDEDLEELVEHGIDPSLN